MQDYLKCGSSFVDYKLRIGEIPSFKIGRFRRIRRSYLERYLDEIEEKNLKARHVKYGRKNGAS